MKTPLAVAPDTVPNRFLRDEDWLDPRYESLRAAFDELYRELGGRPHPYGAACPEDVVIHWSREWEYPWAVLNAELSPGMRVVDLGCGGSPLLIHLQREHDCECIGVDTNLTAGSHYDLRTFPGDPNLLHPQIKWCQESMADMSVAGGWADRVFCISVLEHVASDIARETMQEIRRVLAPDGTALITTDVDGAHRTLTSTYSELIEMASDAGLTLVGDSDFREQSSSRGSYRVVAFCFQKS